MTPRATILLCTLAVLLFWATGVKTTKSPPTFVAFSVGKTSHQFGQGKVTFGKVFLNIGNGFKTNLNVFVTPVDGIYQISLSGLNFVQKGKTKALFIDLYKNKEYILSIYEGNKMFGQGGNTVLLTLLKDDQVFLTQRGRNSGLYGTPQQVYVTFSGHLIVPIFQVTTLISGVVETNPQFG